MPLSNLRIYSLRHLLPEVGGIWLEEIGRERSTTLLWTRALDPRGEVAVHTPGRAHGVVPRGHGVLGGRKAGVGLGGRSVVLGVVVVPDLRSARVVDLPGLLDNLLRGLSWPLNHLGGLNPRD